MLGFRDCFKVKTGNTISFRIIKNSTELVLKFFRSTLLRTAMFTLIKKKIKLSSYIGKIRVEQLQSHIWRTASSKKKKKKKNMGKYLCISSYIRKPFLIYDFATALLWISQYMRKVWFSFLSVQYVSFTLLSTIEGSGLYVFLFLQDFHVLVFL